MAAETHPYDGLSIIESTLRKAVTAGKYWRWSTWGVASLLGVSLLGNIFLGALPKWKPYYIEIDTCGGNVQVVGPAPETWTYAQIAIAATVRHFVEGLRGISMEPEETKKAWRRLESQVTPKGRVQLVQESETLQPLAKRGAVVVETIQVFPKPGSATAYEIRWHEFTYNEKRERTGTALYRGLFAFVQRTPRTPEEFQDAPLGVFFDEWHYQKDQS
jgi:type IV secretory pathway TrbF-like protein